MQASADWTPYSDPTVIDINPQTGQPTPRPYLDVLFNSSGSVANAPYGQTMLWVQHNDRTNDNLLLTIFTRTGKIAPYTIFDVGGQDPYGLARSGQTPGL